MLNRVKTAASMRLHHEPDLQSFTEKYPSFISADIGLLIIEILGNPNEQTADYRVLATNSEFEKLSGLRENQGKLHSETLLLSISNTAWLADCVTVIRTGKAKQQIIQNQANHWWEICIYKIGQNESRLAAIVFQDITRYKQTEGTLAFQAKLLALIAEMRKADENKNNFLRILSHELRNPLSSIMMSLSLLEKADPQGDEAKQAKEILDRQTHHLSCLVDDLLETTRINLNQVKLKKERLDLNRLVQGAVKDYQAQFKSSGKLLKLKLHPAPLIVEADPTRLTQAIGNLLHNAVKFTTKGGYASVRVEQDAQKQEAVITVKDNGRGIRPDLLPDIFSPFIQADDSFHREHGGLGLGLVIVKGMVELHAGNITADSEGLGKGAQFTIRLPISKAFKPKPDEPPTSAGSGQSRRILVIDDIRDMTEILCSLLRHLGHEVISAHDGLEGIAKALVFRPEVLLCDIGLPDINGYEVARRFKSNEKLKDIFLIALTGYVQSEDLSLAKKSGFNQHLAKPVTLADLEQALAIIPQFRVRRYS